MRDRARQGFGGDYKMLRNKCVKLVRRDRMQTQCIIFGSVADSGDPITVDEVAIAPTEKISILGFTLDSKLNPQIYLKELTDGVLYRKHVVGRLSAHLPHHVLKMFARATVLGKIRTYLHLALKVRLSQSDPVTFWGKKLQVVVNDVARIVGRKRRSDHVRVEDLLKKAGLQAVNSMVCSNSAMLAWRASKPESPLHSTFLSMVPNGNTRNRTAGKIEVPAPDTKNSGTWPRLGMPSKTSDWQSPRGKRSKLSESL